MRQVPNYLIIGDGRVAHHFQYYFSLLNLSFQTWYRQQPLELLREKIISASHILLLINDSQIESVAKQCLKVSTVPVMLHFSGSVVTELAYGAHPLMSFNHSLYDFSQYQNIPFILDHDAPEFSSLLPGLPNPHSRLNTALKAKYHALCVLSGNFSCMLWQKLFREMEENFNLPKEFAQPYLKQQMHNLIDDYFSALTGPLVRNDQQTIQKNLQALEGDCFKSVYQSFVECYQNLQRGKHEYP